MICLSSSAVMIMANDGTKKSFEAEELQSRLIRSCLASGIKDYWLAEDLTNAVENALIFQSNSGIVFSESEINSFLVKLLEDAGYPNVAENFRDKNKAITENITLSYNAVKKLFKTQLGLEGDDLTNLSEKVLNACDSLSVSSASPSLLLELARHYKKFDISIPKIKNLNYQDIALTPWVLSIPEILPLLSADTQKLIKLGLIDIAGVSRLFPSIKINLKLEILAEYYGLKPIITELVLFPCFDIVINNLNEIITRINRHFTLKEDKCLGKTLPTYLRFPDIYSFAKKYFGVHLPAGEKFCLDIAVMLAENLKYPVSIKGLRLYLKR
jgi:hypothetical protein